MIRSEITTERMPSRSGELENLLGNRRILPDISACQWTKASGSPPSDETMPTATMVDGP